MAPAVSPFALACFTTLGLILEVLVVKEVLFARREDEIRPTFRALQDTVHKLWHLAPALNTALLLCKKPNTAYYSQALRMPFGFQL